MGFPGETEAEFEQTMALIDEIGFDTSFSFIYSARPGTPAAGLTDEVPESIKKPGCSGYRQKFASRLK